MGNGFIGGEGAGIGEGMGAGDGVVTGEGTGAVGGMVTGGRVGNTMVSPFIEISAHDLKVS